MQKLIITCCMLPMLLLASALHAQKKTATENKQISHPLQVNARDLPWLKKGKPITTLDSGLVKRSDKRSTPSQATANSSSANRMRFALKDSAGLNNNGAPTLIPKTINQ